MIKVDLTGALPFLSGPVSIDAARSALDSLESGQSYPSGAGWRRLPELYDDTLSGKIRNAAKKIRSESKSLVVIGIGGSYLGARAAIEFLRTPNYNLITKNTPNIFFAGTSLSGDSLEQLMALVGSQDFSVNVVSKSGSTLEPSVAFRLFKKLLEAKYGQNGARERIYVTTDGEHGRLKQLADREGYRSFVIPGDIGGRFSVLTPVGLLPAAAAGIDIDAVMAGAREEMEGGAEAALLYASARQALYSAGKKVEILSCFEPSFRYMGEWWKQLFGESEGKDGKGIFPASAEFTTDLHSLGQYIQDGERSLMETFVSVGEARSYLVVPRESPSCDGLDAISGHELRYLNSAAFKATKTAHIDGGVPVMELGIPNMSERSFGALVYFFELSCAVSALISGVNPFDQPGVEAYKKNLFSILGLK